MLKFVELTSFFDTPLYVRVDLITTIEGFTMKSLAGREPHKHEGHIGARITIMTGTCSESWTCLETVEEVIMRLTKAN